MGHNSKLEARLARKVTRAAATFEMIQEGDRIMVGLSGGKDSWVLMQLLDVLRRRAPIDFSIIAVNVDSGCEQYKHHELSRACQSRGCCPVCGDLSLRRQRLKRLLLDFEAEHPGVKRSMLKALGNVVPRHLLDTRLNPSRDLRERAAANLVSAGALGR